MKVEPISEFTPNATAFELEVVAGRARHAPKGARKGWKIATGKKDHLVLLPERDFRSALRPRLLADDVDVVVPRRGGRTISFTIDGHAASVERWTSVEPLDHWSRRAGPRRAGLLGLLAGLLSAGLAAGAAAGSLRQRRSRTFWRLAWGGRPAGTWIATGPDADPGWEFVAADEDLASAATDWDRQADLRFRAAPDTASTVDDGALVEELGRITADTMGRWVEIEPVGARAFIVRLDVEGTAGGPGIIAAKIPVGPGGRRAALKEIGWQLETQADTTTRYYVRRFTISGAGELSSTVGEVRSAYGAIYGDRLRIERWRFSSGEAGTLRLEV